MTSLKPRPGRAGPGARAGTRGPNSPVLRDARRAVPVRRRRPRAALRADAAHCVQLTGTCRAWARTERCAFHGRTRARASLQPRQDCASLTRKQAAAEAREHPRVPGEAGAGDAPDLRPRCRAASSGFDRRLETPWDETVDLRAACEGLSPSDIRRAVSARPWTRLIASLGVTAVERAAARAPRGALHPRARATSIGFLTDAGLRGHGHARRRRSRSSRAWAKGTGRIEVIHVVYNHTAEGTDHGRVQGIDNASSLRLMPDDPSRYMDGTGQLNPVHPSAA